MNYTKAEVIEALVNEWVYLCQEDPSEDDDTPEEHSDWLGTLSWDELMEETGTDVEGSEEEMLEDFMKAWG